MTNDTLSDITPKQLWKNFSLLNAIPRGSKKENQVVQFMLDFGRKLGLPSEIDSVKNVLIKKPATPGMEDRKTVVLQSHLDMVHQKNNDTVFDFDKQGIEMYVEDDWVKARGTTLGADNGLGVAAIMSILESKNIAHPAIEALFTIDEETGMTGAKGLQEGFLQGEILLNLDTEEDDEIDIGCAGGVDVTAEKSYVEVAVPEDFQVLKITLKGLQGGHSGMDIHKGLGNANKIMNRILSTCEEEINITEMQGGSLRNAIPRESVVTFVFDPSDREKITEEFKKVFDQIKAEYISVEPGIELKLEPTELPSLMVSDNDQRLLFESIEEAHNGVFKMSESMDDLVEASNNIAKIVVKNGKITVENLTRSSVESSKKEVAEKLRKTFENRAFKVTFSGDYPGWSPNSNSQILSVLSKLYKEVFKIDPKIVACHAGLECGIIGSHYPKMDMISFGPTIRGAHSPVEKASISSSQKFWKFLLEILKNIPKKQTVK